MRAPFDIAIVGYGGVFPGARDLAEFWENIRTAIAAAHDHPPVDNSPRKGARGTGTCR